MNHTIFANWVTIWVVHFPEQAGLIFESDQTVWASYAATAGFWIFYFIKPSTVAHYDKCLITQNIFEENEQISQAFANQFVCKTDRSSSACDTFEFYS